MALESRLPVVIDAGALDLLDEARGPVIITPHARELSRLLTQRNAARATELGNIQSLTEVIAQDPASWSEYAADELGVVVLLKGHETHIAEPRSAKGTRFHVKVTSPTTWLATAGTGDVLAGILGALVATNQHPAENLARLAATASFIHGFTAQHATSAGPFGDSELIASLPGAINKLVQTKRSHSAK